MKRFWRVIIALAGFLAAFSVTAHAYTTVTISTGTTEITEQQFIASTTNQFLSKLIVNQFFPNTYQLTIYGLNPDYQPPFGEYVVQIGTPTHMVYQSTSSINDIYVEGFSDGLTSEQMHEQNFSAYYYVNCSSPTAFSLYYASTSTFDSNTCMDAIYPMWADAYQLQISTPPLINGILP